MTKYLTLSIAFLVLIFSKSYAVNPDTLDLTNYLKLYDNTFTIEYNFGWFPHGNKNEMTLSYSEDKQLGSLYIKLDNGNVISPQFGGWAYSYRKLNDHLFWLIYYIEGESGTSLLLSILDTRKKIFSKPYQLANAFGDQGDWAYKYGKFENDSTYNYLLVYGDQEKTIDSIIGQDKIRLNGELIEISKRKLKK
jgi:hypothetical protein